MPDASALVDIWADPCDNIWRWIRICAIHDLSFRWLVKSHYVVNTQPFDLAVGANDLAFDLCLN